MKPSNSTQCILEHGQSKSTPFILINHSYCLSFCLFACQHFGNLKTLKFFWWNFSFRLQQQIRKRETQIQESFITYFHLLCNMLTLVEFFKYNYHQHKYMPQPSYQVLNSQDYRYQNGDSPKVNTPLFSRKKRHIMSVKQEPI